ncbi:hypothetical protein GC101_08855 [Paenibacillus sp. LMG 31459]|uniref:Arabinogalactan endo-beta-1,4-galactanase n=1 Tax=Paenibacillus phytohabitans TaxID=2654978 RepID=A0ABX1YDC6_9BACL|nr:glycosyl hydrolase 53 family protein [Paenibacillus phytohabitans]NOU78990.1 hypothetical protein [Paenibacillus phytohabitans]
MVRKIGSCLLSVFIVLSTVFTSPVMKAHAQDGGPVDGNLGFESDVAGWMVNGNVVIQNSGGKNGKSALMKSGSVLTKTITGIPQGSYTVSMWVKGAASSNSANITVKDTGGPDSVLKIDTFLDASTWREMAHRNVLVYNGQMSISINAGTSSGLQIDEVAITLDSEDNNPVQNWNFEDGLSHWDSKGTAALDSTHADTGTNTVKLADQSEVSQKLTVKPDTDYIATVRMKVDKQDTYKSTDQYNLSGTSVLGVFVERLSLGNRVNLGVRGTDGVVLRQAPASTEGYALVTVAFHTGINQTEVELYANTIHDQNYINSVTVNENKYGADNNYPNGWQRPNPEEIDNTHPADEWVSNGSQFAYVDNFDVFEASNEYIKGADMSFLQTIEDAGGKYFANGVQQDALRILSNHGVNSVLTTLWVKAGNPVYDWNTLTPLETQTIGYDGEAVTGRQIVNGYFDKEHSIAMGKRLTELNMTYTPSFHYSDTWISSAKAHMPYEWIEQDYEGKLSNPDIQMLETAVYNYVHDTLTGMKAEGVDVISVKNGNEQDGGLLFPVASGSKYHQHAAIITASSRASKEIYPGAINTIHSNTGYDSVQIANFFQSYEKRGAEFDGMAFSLYGGRETTGQFVMMNAAMANPAAQYYDYLNVETAFTFTRSSPIGDTGSGMALLKYYNMSPNGQYNFLLDYIQAPLDLPNPYGTTRGFYYWNAEAIPVYGAGHKAGEAVEGSQRILFNNGTPSIKEMGSPADGKVGDMMDSMFAFLHRGDTKRASDTVYSPLRFDGTNYDVGEAASLSFQNDNLSLKVGEVGRLQPVIAPMDKLLDDYTIRYTSDQPGVAGVSEHGFITGISAGTAVITAQIGNVSSAVTVTVNEPDSASGINITYEVIRGGATVNAGTVSPGSTIDTKPYDKIKFKSAVTGNPTDNAVVYTVSDPEIAGWYGDTWQTDDRIMRTLADKLSASSYEPVVQLNPRKAGMVNLTAASDDGAAAVNFKVTVTQTDVTGISIVEGNRSVLAGKSLKLTASVTPGDASFYKVYWSSSDESVAKVDSNGLVTAIKPGAATITIQSDANPEITSSITLTVTDVSVDQLLLSSSKLGILAGQSKTLTYMALPDNAVNRNVIWSVKPGDEAILSVDQNGTVTGLQPGTGTVIITSADGSAVTAECVVIVVDHEITATSMALSHKELWIKSDYFSPDPAVQEDRKPVTKLDAVFMPEETTNTDVLWSSDNAAVASVDASGVITAHKPGVAVISAQSADGSLNDNATVYVPHLSEDWDNYEAGSKGGFTDSNTFTYSVVDAAGDQQIQAAVKGQKGAGSPPTLSRRAFTPVSGEQVVVDFDWNVGSFTPDSRSRGGHISIEDANGNTYLALATYPAVSGKDYEMTYYLFNGSTAMPTKNNDVNGSFNYIHGGGGAGGTYADTADVGTGFKGANKDYNVRLVLNFKSRQISFTVTDKNNPSITSTVSGLAMDSRVNYSDSFGAIAFSHYFNSNASWATTVDNLAVYNTSIQAERIDYTAEGININPSEGIKLVPVADALSATAKINARVIPASADQSIVFTPLGELANAVTIDPNGVITVNPGYQVEYGQYDAIQSASGNIRVSSLSTPEVYTDVKVTIGSPNASETLQVYVDGREYLGAMKLAADAAPKLTYVATGGDGISDIYAYDWQVTSGNAQIDAGGKLSVAAPGNVTVTFTIDLFRKQEVRTLEFTFMDLENQQVAASPDPGTYSAPVSVTLNTEPDSSIYYTTDGSEPGLSSQLYSEPLYVGKDTVIKAVAVYDGTLAGQAAEFEYKIVIPRYTVTYDVYGGTGAIPPEADRAEGEAFAAAEISGVTAPEGKRFKEWNTASDGSGIAYAAGAIVSMPAGNLTLYAIWVENDGPVEEVDTAAPVWEADSKLTAAAVAETSLTLTWNAAVDNVGVTGYKVTWIAGGTEHNKAVAGNETRVTINGLEPDTSYTFKVEAADAAGNWSGDGPGVEVTTNEVSPVEPQPPVEPEQPVEPQPPVEPEQPMEPQPPVEPEQPVQPEPSATPQPPVQPGQPAQAQVIGQVVDSQQPVMPEQSAGPEQPAVQPIEFRDVPVTHWAATAIARAAALGIIQGNPDYTFMPNKPTSRAEFITMLANAFKWQAGQTEQTKPVFKDNDKIGVWAKDAVAEGAERGIITGYADGSFRPNQEITRTEMIVMLVKALGIAPSVMDHTQFADDAVIPAWGKSAVEALRGQGLLTGRSNNHFAPNDSATRAEAIVIILRALAD